MTDFMAWLRGHLAQGAVAPRYIQLATAIETAIRQQVLAAEAFLPPERQMAEGLALSRVTVSKAMKLLEEKGLITRGRSEADGRAVVVITPRIRGAPRWAPSPRT